MVPTAHTQIDVRLQPLESSLGRVPQAADRLSHALRLEMVKQCRKTTPVAHFRGSTLPTLANQILARANFRSRLVSICVPSRWKVLSGEFRRRPTALAIKFRTSDRVGRRGLSEPRENFSRLLTYAFPRLWPRLCPWLFPRLYPRLCPWLCPRKKKPQDLLLRSEFLNKAC